MSSNNFSPAVIEAMHQRGFCVVCNKNRMDWCGYDIEHLNGFCEDCKVEFIKWANKNFGVKFGTHERAFGVKDGHNGCPMNKSNVEIKYIWDKFMNYKGNGFVFR